MQVLLKMEYQTSLLAQREKMLASLEDGSGVATKVCDHFTDYYFFFYIVNLKQHCNCQINHSKQNDVNAH